jgi:predicted metalloprotease with PDZ domain
MVAARILRLLLIWPIAVLPATALAVEPTAAVPDISYVVTVDQPTTHVFAVQMKVTGTDQAPLDVSMPVWTPGSYLVREYERHVIRFSVKNGQGEQLAWHKLDKNTWRIDAAGADEVLVSYQVYAREPGIRWSFLYDKGGHILGPNLFMYVVGLADLPTSARFQLPEGWRLDGGIAPSPDDPYLVHARSYHELIDTPMLIGEFTAITFEILDTPHVIAILGPNNADLERLRDDFSTIVETCAEMFGGLPYDRYAFIYMTVVGGGGIEHANGTTIGLGDLDLQSESAYRAVLGVTSHEFFHAWNVKRIQPPAFRPYDYEEENYTDALWFYEGITSYYGDRILLRAGLIDELPSPVDLVSRYRSIPGHAVQSAADASFNAWIHYYRSDESTNNYRTDYYFKGNVIGNLLTLEIATRTDGQKSIDDVMRLMWEKTRDEGASFDSDDIRAVCEEVAGGSFREFFERYVFGTDDIPFEDFFKLAGYELVVDEVARRAMNRVGYMGVYLGESGGRASIDGVVRGGPAWRAGLDYGDIVLAVDGMEVEGVTGLRQAIAGHGPGDTLDFRVLRLGEERAITLTLGERTVPAYRLAEVESPTALQLAVRRRWRQ